MQIAPMIARTFFLGCSALALSASPGFAASFTYTTLAEPGASASSTQAYGINDSDVVVGGAPNVGAFVWQNGAYTVLPGIGYLFDISSSAIAVGVLPDQKSPNVYVLYNVSAGSTQTFTLKSSTNLLPLYINSSNLVVGELQSKRNPSGVTVQGTTLKKILYNRSKSVNAYPAGVNDAGAVVGTLSYGEVEYGYTYFKNKVTLFSVPNGYLTTGDFIAADGTVGGTYQVQSVVHGYIMKSGNYTTIDYPGAVRTYVTDMNSSGEVVGYYFNADNSSHGFVSVAGKFYSIDYPGGTETGISHINALGSILGSYSAGGQGPVSFIGQCASGKTCTK